MGAEHLAGMKLGQFTNSAKEEIQLLASFVSTLQLCEGVKVNDSDSYYGSNRVAVYTSLSDPDAHELRANKNVRNKKKFFLSLFWIIRVVLLVSLFYMKYTYLYSY